jgi:hypothetical protein
MVDDEELNRHVNRVESRNPHTATVIGGSESDTRPLEEHVEEMQAAARETHSELAARIRRVDEAAADEAALAGLADRMDEIESRLAAVEEKLDD